MIQLSRSFRHIVLRSGWPGAVARRGVGGVLPAVARAQFGVDKTEFFLNPSVSAERTGVSRCATKAMFARRPRSRSKIGIGPNRERTDFTKRARCRSRARVRSASFRRRSASRREKRKPSGSSSTRPPTARWRRASAGRWSPSNRRCRRPAPAAACSCIACARGQGLRGAHDADDGRTGGRRRDAHRRRPIHRHASDTVEVAFQNTGTKHVVAHGRVEVRRPDNSTVAVVELPPAYALPGATMRVRAALPALAGRPVRRAGGARLRRTRDRRGPVGA